MQINFKGVIDTYDSAYMNEKNILEREKHDALQINKYKELYKMEKIKREEEEMDKEKDLQVKKEEQEKHEKQERIRQEQLRIKTEKEIEVKEEEFKMIQKETLVKKVDQLPQYMKDYVYDQEYLKKEIADMSQ